MAREDGWGSSLQLTAHTGFPGNPLWARPRGFFFCNRELAVCQAGGVQFRPRHWKHKAQCLCCKDSIWDLGRGDPVKHQVESLVVPALCPGWWWPDGSVVTIFSSSSYLRQVMVGHTYTHTRAHIHMHANILNLPLKRFQVIGLKPICKWKYHIPSTLWPFFSFKTVNGEYLLVNELSPGNPLPNPIHCVIFMGKHVF